jgi:iron complex transport system ATP-binding protein
MTMVSYINISDISFAYLPRQDENIFENISFTVNKGEIFYLLGPNGTGKSTLLKCISGILKIQKGSILLENKYINFYSTEDIAKKMAFVPQSHTSAFPFLVKDVVIMGRSPYVAAFSSPKADDITITEKAMETVGITHIAERPCTNISGGEWQLVLIARALTQEPEILLLDEPTSHLDLGNQIKILNVIHSLADKGLTIIMATHFPDHAFIKSDNVAILKDKSLLKIGIAENVITEETMKKAYGVDVKIIHAGDGIDRKLCVPIIKSKDS